MLHPYCLKIVAALLVCVIMSPTLSGQSPRVEAWPDTGFLNAFQYRCIGPVRGGRVTAVAGTASRPSEFYMGSTGGGVWKTTDYGITWDNVSDGYFASPSIGAIRVAPSNPDIVYVGTGSDGIRSNIIAGKGVYRSDDAGKTWMLTGLEKTGQIGAVEVHPDNPDIVYVAAIGQAFQPNPERGVYRTPDGGRTWEQVLFIADTVGVADLELAPGNPDLIYAAAWRVERKPWNIFSGGKNGGIYKSEDGGRTWKKTAKGLPAGLIGKIDLAISPADPKRLYALVEAPDQEGGLYRSDDYGETFNLVSIKKELLYRPFYYCNVDADPQNPDVVYVSAEGFFKSVNGGKSWTTLRTPHGDNHDMWINPNDSLLFIQANDGGVNITTNGGKSWSSQNNQPTAELYQVEADDSFPYRVYAGQQDNTTIAVPVFPPRPSPGGPQGFWEEVGGCETGPAVPKPGNPDIVYSNCKGRFGVYNRKTGQEQQYYIGASNIYGHHPADLKFRFQRVAPIHVSPHDPDVIYHASQYLHKTTDDGKTWEIISPDLTANDPDRQVVSGAPITRDVTGEEYFSTIYSIAESPVREGLIWAGANDGPVHVTRNGGKTWKNVTPKGLPAGGRVDCVEPSPHREGKAYFTTLLYQMGDWKPYIFKTENYGQTWTLLTDGRNGIPGDAPTRVVREDPEREGLLYAGTENGIYISFDDGRNWVPFQQNLPVTPVTDIKVHRGDLLVSTMGRSFWMVDNLSSLRQFTGKITESGIWLFQPRDAWRLRYEPSGRKDLPEYPAPAATIDYYLRETPGSEVTLDIFNARQELIRSFSSIKKTTEKQEENPDMSTGFRVVRSGGELKKSAGLHRFQWDMRHQGPWDKDPKKAARSGPMVAPGTYTLRLSADGVFLTQTLKILPDPRLEQAGITAADLAAQENLALNIRDLQSQAQELMENVRAAVKKRRQEQQNDVQAVQKMLSAVEKELVTAGERYSKPMIIDQIKYLASMMDVADQAPGKDAFDRYQELKTQLDKLAADARSLTKPEVSED